MSEPIASAQRWRLRWFPFAVVGAAAAWWMWQTSIARYYTFRHVITVLLTLIAIGVWYVAFGGGSHRRRRRIATVAGAAVVVFFALLRPVYNGDMGIYAWRWRFATSADSVLKQLQPSGAADDWSPTPRDYPRFLGAGYWAEVKNVDLELDWKAHPPKELWRHEIGAGWSAFAIVGDYAVTQEQRGENELVSCYRLQTGEPVWTHFDVARFDPASVQGSLGDIGPRATPTIHDGKVITQGGTGIVNCLDARTGNVLWSHDTAIEFGVDVLMWGKAGSPLIVDDLVVISVGVPATATDFDGSLVAFDLATGDVRWKAGKRQASYSSPVLATFGGEPQIIVVNQGWVTAHRLSDGKVLWEHPWPTETDSSATCPQPIPLAGDRLLLCKGYGVGSSLFSIKRGDDDSFIAKPLWEPMVKSVMKSKFSNVVIHENYVYGLDDVLLECMHLDTGEVQWKKRRQPVFGHGQIMLIGDVVLVLSETGELALVRATEHDYHEFANLQALDNANITWNNPAFAAPYLLIRNAREAACYELPLRK